MEWVLALWNGQYMKTHCSSKNVNLRTAFYGMFNFFDDCCCSLRPVSNPVSRRSPGGACWPICWGTGCSPTTDQSLRTTFIAASSKAEQGGAFHAISA